MLAGSELPANFNVYLRDFTTDELSEQLTAAIASKRRPTTRSSQSLASSLKDVTWHVTTAQQQSHAVVSVSDVCALKNGDTLRPL